MRRLGKLTAIVLGTLLAGGMAFGLVGCGGGPQEGQTTIRFWYTASISENRIMQNMIDDYNKGQGIEDGVYVDGDNRQNIERTALYVDTPDVLTVTDENFKSWAIEGLFTDLSDYYANDPGDYTEEGIPEAYTQTFRASIKRWAKTASAWRAKAPICRAYLSARIRWRIITASPPLKIRASISFPLRKRIWTVRVPMPKYSRTATRNIKNRPSKARSLPRTLRGILSTKCSTTAFR